VTTGAPDHGRGSSSTASGTNSFDGVLVPAVTVPIRHIISDSSAGAQGDNDLVPRQSIGFRATIQKIFRSITTINPFTVTELFL